MDNIRQWSATIHSLGTLVSSLGGKQQQANIFKFESTGFPKKIHFKDFKKRLNDIF